jgi:hypothetical protein
MNLNQHSKKLGIPAGCQADMDNMLAQNFLNFIGCKA